MKKYKGVNEILAIFAFVTYIENHYEVNARRQNPKKNFNFSRACIFKSSRLFPQNFEGLVLGSVYHCKYFNFDWIAGESAVVAGGV